MKLAKYDIVFNRKKHLNSKSKAAVELRIRLNGKYKYFTLFQAEPNQFDKAKNKLNNRYPNANIKNKYLADLPVQLERFELNLIEQHQSYSLDDYNIFFNDTKTTTFNELVKGELDASMLKKSTIRQQRGFLAKLDAFNPQIKIQKINYELLKGFESFLRAQKLSANTVHKAFKNFSKYYNIGINLELIQQKNNPFKLVKIKTEPSKRQFISYMNVRKIERLKLEQEKELYEIRELFLFGVYTGIRFDDLINLRKEQVEWGPDGACYIGMVMEKTKGFVNLPLHSLFNGKPRDILFKRLDSDGLYFFSKLSNQHVNRMLKVIGQMIELNQPLTFHVSRHTFGTCLLNFNMPLVSVQQLMGHKNIRQTQEYAKLLTATVENQLNKISYNV